MKESFSLTAETGCSSTPTVSPKPLIRMAWASGAVYKIGKRVLIRRDIFEEYLRAHQKQVDKLIEGDEEKLLKIFEAKAKEEHENEV